MLHRRVKGEGSHRRRVADIMRGRVSRASAHFLEAAERACRTGQGAPERVP